MRIAKVTRVASWVVIATCLCASGADRKARMIDTLGFHAGAFDDYGTAAVSLWGEVATMAEGGDWSFLVGGEAGTLAPDEGGDVKRWAVGLGLKHYFYRDLSGSAMVRYHDTDARGDSDGIAFLVGVKQRLLSADEPLSPFLAAGLGLQSDGVLPGSDGEATDSLFIGQASVGCDFMMRSDFALVVEGGYQGARELGGGGHWEHGLTGSIAMKYYWR